MNEVAYTHLPRQVEKRIDRHVSAMAKKKYPEKKFISKAKRLVYEITIYRGEL